MRRKRLIRDLLDGNNDVVDLAEKYGVSADALAAWIAEPANQRCLAGLCTLADVQTQLMLSRWRHHAANRLIRYATDKESPASLARRACVDLLKLEMKRADRGEVDDVDDAAAESLRALLASDLEASSASSASSDEPRDAEADGDRPGARDARTSHGDGDALSRHAQRRDAERDVAERGDGVRGDATRGDGRGDQRGGKEVA